MAKYLQGFSIGIPEEEKSRWSHPSGYYSSNFLESLYISCLGKAESKGVSYLQIVACTKLPEKPLELTLRKPDCYKIARIFDFEGYFKAIKEEQKKRLLDFVQGGLLETAKHLHWKTEPFKKAYDEVLAKRIINYLPWSKPIGSPDRKHKAQAWCHFDSDKAEIFIVITRRREVVSKTLAAAILPGVFKIREAAWKLNWASSGKVELWSKGGNVTGAVELTISQVA